MSIMPINNVNISFKGNDTKVKTQQEQTIQKSIKDNKKKLIIGGLAIASVAIASIAIARSGKKPKNLNFEEFKQNGEFNKGVAKYKNKLFNGTIEVPNKTGKHILEYENGILKSSTKYNKTRMIATNKKVYEKNGDTKTITTFVKGTINRGWNEHSKTIITPNKITRTRGDYKTIVEKQQDGSFKIIDTEPKWRQIGKHQRKFIYETDRNTGEVLSKKLVKETPEDIAIVKSKKESVIDGKKIVENYENGKLVSTQTIETLDDKTKKITVDYGDDRKMFIQISPEGEKTETYSEELQKIINIWSKPEKITRRCLRIF